MKPPAEIDGFLAQLYQNRFSEREQQRKDVVWEVLCRDFFQRYVDTQAVVLDIGAGRGEFINHIRCAQKYAVDVNDDVARFLAPEVKFFRRSSDELSFLARDTVDVVFMSNFSEHLRTKEEMISTLLEIMRVLKVNGRLIIIGPNIRYAYREYWDFFDHHIPLSDKGMAEVLKALHFSIDTVIPQFLPYTTKSRIPKNALCVRLYLKVPLIWKILGKQMLVIASKRKSSEI
jgi:SAM-dependent methyltransferase